MGRLRIFAGPNGSGKSTIIESFEYNLGYYLNADDISKELRLLDQPIFNLAQFGINVLVNDFYDFLENHGLFHRLKKSSPKRAEQFLKCTVSGERITFRELPGNYEVALLTDFIRFKLLEKEHTFSFETVFSHPDKVDFISQANDAGFRTYLYFIATESADINVARVKQRVALEGHDVPEDKIRSRYANALENLLPALRLAYKSFIFDNSSKKNRLFATVSPDKTISIIQGEKIPAWFTASVLDKLS